MKLKLTKKQISKILKDELAFDKDNMIIVKNGIAQRDLKKGEVLYYYPSTELMKMLRKGGQNERTKDA